MWPDQQKNAIARTAGQLRVLYLIVLWLVWVSQPACSRSKYRKAADVESYGLIESRQTHPLWELPERSVEPDKSSRMYVAAELESSPKPQDDPAAKRYMDYPGGWDNSLYYNQISTRYNTENPVWIDYLPRDKNGMILLTSDLANEMGLLHSRDYQTQFENVYLNALSLSGNRFEFGTQWNGGFGAGFNASGKDLGDDRELSLTLDRLGFSRNLPGGGEFATGLVNRLFFDFGSGTVQGGSAALVTTFTQPLLRGAFRYVRLENLTQAERNLLYSVRDFARFRRLFYVDVSTGFLNLLTQIQAIRNAESNVQNLRQNLIEHDFYVQIQLVSQIQRDQVFQQYQNGRLSLLTAEQGLATSLDAYKFELGLPPWVPLQIDESMLDSFELSNPEVSILQDEAQELFVSLMQYIAPAIAPRDVLLNEFQHYVELRERTAELLTPVEEEFALWQARLDVLSQRKLSPDDELDFQQQRDLAIQIESVLNELRTTLNLRQESNAWLLETIQNGRPRESEEGLPSPNGPSQSQLERSEIRSQTRNLELVELNSDELLRDENLDPQVLAWQALQEAVGTQLRGELAELYVAQTQIRLFLIDIEPLELNQESAITYAHQNRLDVMNLRAETVDAFRHVEVAADRLESDLSVSGDMRLGSDPDKNNPFRFDSSANRYALGLEFDGPLNRLNERNVYRAAQIDYQRANRNLLAGKDRVANEIRAILRQLELNRLSFQIARQQLVAATRQVDQAQIDLRQSSRQSAQSGSSLTLLLLDALDGVLAAKNRMILSWVNYRTQRMRLFAALELLYLDENGRWINESDHLDAAVGSLSVDPEYFPPEWTNVPNPSQPEQISAEVESSEQQTDYQDLP